MTTEQGRPRRLSRRGRRAAFVAAVLVMPLAGCSMVVGLAGGTPSSVYAVQQASIDVLMEQKVPVLVAPVCEVNSDKQIVCSEGKTTTGQPITVTVSGEKPPSATISVGGKQIFTGSVNEVVEKAGRVKK